MKSTPILFSTPMVQALLAGRKTQTRRIVKPQPIDNTLIDGNFFDGKHRGFVKVLFHLNWQKQFAHLFCPYGIEGDQLWVREKWYAVERTDYGSLQFAIFEDEWIDSFPKEDAPIRCLEKQYKWGGHPSIHMPRAISRITLEITGIRVERLQDISEEDALAEGIETRWEDLTTMTCMVKNYLTGQMVYDKSYRFSYQTLWESINGPGSWEANPWVWVLEFKRVK